MGYQQVVIPAQQFTMIGVMYQDPSGVALNIQDLFKDPLAQGLTGATGAANADQLMYWDTEEAGSYVTLYLNSNTGTSSALMARHNKWCLTSTQPKDTTWGTRNNASTKPLVSGMGLWLKRLNYSTPITLTMAHPALPAWQGTSFRRFPHSGRSQTAFPANRMYPD